MILDLIKFAFIFFLPTILGKAIGMYRNFRQMKFSAFSWGSQSWSSRLANLVGVTYIVWKLFSMFLYGQANFYMTVQTRMDSPGYIIRNQYRNYVSQWANAVPEVSRLQNMKAENQDLSSFPDKSLLKEFENMEFLSEQLKIKDKKALYSKFGEYAFVNCKYCTSDLDYIMFLTPSTLLEYATFLFVVGVITSQYFKLKWRSYSSIVVILAILNDVNNYYFYDHTKVDLYDSIFGEDFFTLRSEKMEFIRNSLFVLFTMIIIIFDNAPDRRIQDLITGIGQSLEAALGLLQSTRLQKAAVSTNDDLKKYSIESLKKEKFVFADIISDPTFRAKVAESGSQLEMDRIIEQHGEKLEQLMNISLKQD